MSRVLYLVGAGHPANPTDPEGPTEEELAEIERTMPLIKAEETLVEAEIRVLCAEPHPTDLDWRHLRRAETAVAREFLALFAAGVPLEHLGWAA